MMDEDQANFRKPFQHLENIDGTDKLKGKNIAVVGTPNKPYFFYLLWASLLRIDYTPDEVEMFEQLVEHNGYQFSYMTFGNQDLRRLQFHFIEATLIQGIGRARMLRTNAKVEVLQNSGQSEQ